MVLVCRRLPANQKNYVSAFSASDVVGQGGVGAFSLIDLQKVLAGKAVSVSPGIGSLYEGINGSASPDDIETMFQLIYLYFTEPRKDSTAFLAFRSQVQGFLANRSASPQAAFSDTVQVTMAQGHIRARPISAVNRISSCSNSSPRLALTSDLRLRIRASFSHDATV